MASADILRAARARIADPKNWTQNTFAKDADGVELTSYDLSGDEYSAVCWCAYGAIYAESSEPFSDAGHFLRRAARELFNSTVIRVNDYFGHDAVMRLYDAAIAAAEAEAGR